MSVLIKGMEIPTNCCQCPVNMEVCKRGYKFLLAHPELYDKRADDCPLVPVPPHGDLIDRDDFFAICPELVDWYKRITDDLVIIPAEEGEG